MGRGGGGFVTAKDYPSLQEAIDACPSGGRVYAPAGTYVAPSGGFVLNKPLELFGDSISATVLTPYSGTSAGQPVIKIDSSGSTTALRQIYLHDFSLANPSLPTSRLAGSHGISCVTASGHQVTDIKLERVIASALGDDAIHIQGFDVGASAIVFLYVSVVQAIACQGSGFFVQNTTVAEFHNCYANANALFGAYCYSSQAAWYSCAFENNCLRTTSDYVIAGDASSFPYNADTGAQLRMRYSVPARVESCDFEQFGDTTAGQSRLAKKAIVFEASTGGLVSNSSFFNGGGATAVTGTGIHVTSDSNQGGWVTILTNNFINVETPVELQTGVRATTVMPQRISATLPGAPTMSGVLGLAVLARPFSEVPGAPIAEAAGQLIFDTTSGRLKCWDGSFWRTLSW